MLKTKTVLVLGAGASREVDLPTGEELKGEIARIVGTSPSARPDDVYLSSLVTALQIAGQQNQVDRYLGSGHAIAHALPQQISIDHFLHLRRESKEIELCGKLAIARAILQAEGKSPLRVDQRTGATKPNFAKLSDTWFNAFWKLLMEGCSGRGDLHAKLHKLSFVVFNYDRCLEQYLYHSYQNTFGATENQAADFVNEISIFHPYGQVGHLPWQQRAGAWIDFGEEANPSDLVKIAKELKTFTEGTSQDAQALEHMQERVEEADVRIFLGFAFHRLNMDLLFPPSRHREDITGRVFATIKNFSKDSTEKLRRDLQARIPTYAGVDLLDPGLGCANFFAEYWHSISES